jgi:hypothetical protein
MKMETAFFAEMLENLNILLDLFPKSEIVHYLSTMKLTVDAVGTSGRSDSYGVVLVECCIIYKRHPKVLHVIAFIDFALANFEHAT